MRHTMDVPALVTGLITLGFTAVGVWILTGNRLIGDPAMYFATVLIVAGIIGLVVSLRTSRR